MGHHSASTTRLAETRHSRTLNLSHTGSQMWAKFTTPHETPLVGNTHTHSISANWGKRGLICLASWGKNIPIARIDNTCHAQVTERASRSRLQSADCSQLQTHTGRNTPLHSRKRATFCAIWTAPSCRHAQNINLEL